MNEPLNDQRDQDQRRHEQQVQQVQAELRQQQLVLVKKQDEVMRLNQEGARLVLELSHTKQSLYEQLTQGRKLEQKIEQLQSLQPLRRRNWNLMAAETSSVSYRTKMPEEALVAILASDEVPSAFTAHVSHLLDDAQAQILVMTVEQAALRASQPVAAI